MTTHTPGPWTIRADAPKIEIWGDTDNKSFVAELPAGHLMRSGTPDANARLIAAAPALLEALRTAALSLTACADLLYNANQDDKPARHDAYQARKAIAEATGSSPSGVCGHVGVGSACELPADHAGGHRAHDGDHGWSRDADDGGPQ